MNSVILSFPSIIETIKEDQEVIPELGILVDGEYHFSKLGHFYITEFNRDRNANVTTITANDKMTYLEGVYDSKLTYPKPYREVALEIANLAGVEVNQASFASLGIGAIKKPEGYTFRQAIGLIAQFEGGFASFNRDGELEIRRLRPTEFSVTPESYLLKGFTKNENSYKIGGITVRVGEEETDVLKVGTDTGSQVELENKSMTQDLLNQVWRLVKDINYFPYELKWRGCPALEAGDWIYVTDRNGKRYSVPNLSYSMNFNGGLSAESKATTNSVSGNATKYRGTLNQKVQWLESILSSNDWNHNYYDAEPGNPKVGDLWFKKVGKDIEIWQYVETDGVQDWELQISSAPNQELLDMIEDLVKETADAQAAAEEAKAAGEAAEQLAEEAKTESAKAIEDANTAVAGVTNLGQIVQAVDQAAQLAIEQSANAVTDAQAAMVKANELLTTVTELEGTITNITADIDAINGELSVKVDQTTFNQLKGTVDTHSTSISANAQAITQKANQTQVNAIDQTVISHTAELTTQSDKIAGLVTKTDGQSTKISALELQAGQFNLTLSSVQSDLAGLEVGTRNYALMTSVTKIVPQNNYAKHLYDLSNGAFDIESNAEIMVTFDWEAPDATESSKFRLNRVVKFKNGAADQWSGMIVGNGGDVLTKAKKGSYAGIWRWYKTDYSSADISKIEVVLNQTVLGGAIKISNLAVRIGNKATDWTPAPEDMATVTALTSVQATVDGLVTTVATKANQSQVTQLADQITSVVQNTSDLVNKFPDSKFAKKVPEPTAEGSVTYNYDEDGLFVKNNGTTRSRIYWQIGFVVGQTYNIRLLANCEVEVSKIEIGTSEGENLKVNPSLNKNWIEGTIKVTKWTALSIFIEPGEAIRLRELCIYNANTGLTTSQITQLSDQINLRVQKGEVISQINISTEGILIAGEKVWISGLTKIDNAVIATANIKDLAVTNGKIANLAVNTAKIGDAAIVTAKIGDLAVTNAKIANLAINDAKIQNASISSAKIISLDASKVVANTLSAITTNTGTLNVTDWINVTTDNRGIRGTYDFGDAYGEAYNYRWFVGDYRLSHRHLIYTGKGYNVNVNNTKGSYLYDLETFYGIDYLKMRQYTSGGTLLNRIDINANAITMGSGNWNTEAKIKINSDGTGFFGERFNFNGGIDVAAPNNVGLRTGRIDAPLNYNSISINAERPGLTSVEFGIDNIYFNSTRTGSADFRIGKDGSAINGGRVIASEAVYKRTYSGAANMIVMDTGTIGRTTSARKYKADILVANEVMKKAKKVLELSPASWWDKGELADGTAKERYYGFIADEFDNLGLTEVVIYENGQVESLAYDRISMYHNVILTEHEQEINKLKKKVEILENEIRVLQVA
ncbi:hypothetical protein JZO76_00240 [Enterococcus sp. MJM12]|uniref:Peptidase S74 domain-containing protein n=1 Tax=Candidatus Enterococcus myersii TaxID=2815322 RepID=A0ABS3H3B9_9ENTE|nr:hypothetical protein [Enterococcus sp. MJM12]MBO0447957.1 hypothetical protein [Enterococcus sp. MJM12]